MTSHRILHLPKWFPDHTDAQNGIFIDLQIQALNTAHQHCIFSLSKNNTLNKRWRVLKSIVENRTYIQIEYMPSHLLYNLFIQAFLYLKFAFPEAKKSSIIHSHVLGRNMGFAYLFSMFSKAKLVHSEHWSLLLDKNKWDSKPWLYRVFARCLLNKPEDIACVSSALAKALNRIQPKAKTCVIPNVIRPENKTKSPKNDQFTFIHISDLRDDIKNISGLNSAFSLAQQSGLDAELWIVGSGVDEQKLKAQAKSCSEIKFLGAANHDQVYDLLPQAHVLVLNSLSETFGMVVLEAFANGLPVVCAKNGVSDTFVNQDSGICVPIKDNQALAKALIDIKANFEHFDVEYIKSKAELYSAYHVGNQIDRMYSDLF
ncbi:MAG: glycosyltransferase [Flavobacteriales bacterium]